MELGKMTSSSIHIAHLDSQLLKNNPLADPNEREIILYLPQNYEKMNLRYPVTYLLASFAGSARKFLNWKPWQENIQARMDRLINTGKCKPMILVMPDCFTRYGGSQYINSSATGMYSDYLYEIVGYVDEHFQTRSDRAGRAIAGHSSGGYGALIHAMQHPEIFGAAAVHSGDMFFEHTYATDIFRFPDIIRDLDVRQILADPTSYTPKNGDFFQLINMAAMAACYSPNADSELGFDWPVNLQTGELIPDVWERWMAHDPIYKIDSSLDQLRQLRLLYLDCGDRDEYLLHHGARLFSKRLNDYQIPHIYEEYPGGHRNTEHRLEHSLKAISESFELR
jgi:enterochelin esterase-like enzyme